MKKMKMLLSLILVAVGLSANAQNSMIPVSELPVQAKEFLDTHFKNVKVLQVEKEAILGLVRDYEVILGNGMVVEFSKKGDWTEVSGKGKEIPASVVPDKISKYVKTEFPKTFIKKIEKGSKGYEVELSNGLDLKFDLAGIFKRID